MANQNSKDICLGLGKVLFNSSVALIEESDGRADIEIILSERINRVKASGAWPEKSLSMIKEKLNLNLTHLAENRDVITPREREKQLDFMYPFYEMLKKKKLEDFSSYFNENIKYISHHYAHAMAATAVSPYEKSIVVVIDGAGSCYKDIPDNSLEKNIDSPSDPSSHEECSVYLQNGKELKPVMKRWQTFQKSKKHKGHYFSEGLGTFYEKIAEYIFNSKRAAGKVMGLASYGTPYELSSRVEFLEELDWENNQYKGKSKEDWEKNNNQEHYQNIAATVQLNYEKDVLKLFSKLKDQYPEYKNLIFTGGSALNCTSNMKIIENGIYENVFVPAFPGDESIGLGCAAHLYYIEKDKRWAPLKFEEQSAYFGSKQNQTIDQTELEQLFKEYEVIRPASIIDLTVELLMKNKIIGWYQGRSESGPRALGNRSILARIDIKNLKDILNEKIKKRESFRPYGCSCLKEKASEYFEVDDRFESPYMSFCVQVKKKYKDLLKEITHIDNTSRIQTVREGQNKKFYQLLKRYGEKSGDYCLLNTSLNVMGDPIVENLKDAKEFLDKTPVDGIVIGDYYIKKEGRNKQKSSKKITSVILTTKENFVWTSMQEIIPVIEKTWECSSSKTHVVYKIDVDDIKLKESLKILMTADNIVHTAFNVRLAKVAVTLRKDIGIDARFIIYLHNQATIACWPYREWGLSQILTESDIFISTCSRDKETMKYSYQNADVRILPFGLLDVDDQYINTESYREDFIPFVYIGRISEQKNLHTMIYSLFLLKKRLKGRKIYLDIYGGEDGLGSPNMELRYKDYQKFIKSLIKDLELEDVVTMHGHTPREKIYKKLERSKHILLSASMHSDENFGIAALKSLTFASQTVLTYWGGHIDFNEKFPNQIEYVDVLKSRKGPVVNPYEFTLAMEKAIQKYEFEYRAEIPSYYQKQNIAEKITEIIEKENKKKEKLKTTQFADKIFQIRNDYLERNIERYKTEDDGSKWKGCQIFESYYDENATIMLKSYGMDKEIGKLDNSTEETLRVVPWCEIDEENIIIEDPHRGMMTLEKEKKNLNMCVYDHRGNRKDLSFDEAENLVELGYAFLEKEQL